MWRWAINSNFFETDQDPSWKDLLSEYQWNIAIEMLKFYDCGSWQ